MPYDCRVTYESFFSDTVVFVVIVLAVIVFVFIVFTVVEFGDL